MPRPEPNETRGQLRSWLKLAIQTSLLDRVPQVYEPDGPGSGGPTRDYARRLLAAMQGAECSPGAVAEVRAFRTWVEARQQTSRRLILADAQGDGGSATLPGTAKRPPDEPPVRRPIDVPARPEHDPLWDRWLDG